MATTQTNPTPETAAADGSRSIEINSRIFDLDSKDEVLVRKVGTHAPVRDMQDFVSRLNNDSKLILELVDEALEAYEKRQLEADPNVPWQEVGEDGTVIGPFSGTPIAEEKLEAFQKTVLQFAKLMFGYPDGRLPKTATKSERDAAKAKKTEARDAAISMLLSNPAAVEALKG